LERWSDNIYLIKYDIIRAALVCFGVSGDEAKELQDAWSGWQDVDLGRCRRARRREKQIGDQVAQMFVD
jgi:hypothetical protein